MTFLELQKQIVQTRKARKGVKNRTNYFEDCSGQEEQFWSEVYKRSLRVANDVVKHYEVASTFDKAEKVSVLFGEQRKNNDTFEELLECQHEISRLTKELEQVKAELARAKIGGRRKDYGKEARIQLYKHEHPDASIRTIAKAVGCSTTTVQNALKTVKSDDDGTLSMMNIPRDKKKLEQIIEGLLTAISKDTNEKDRQIHLQALRWHQLVLDELVQEK
ncbi:hypothetical protein [Selenomonas ruminantium]|uniref:Uncharacterized protein n=1 Tax=Selenomonas ruminantium TaxID=971 RepID=A0A1I0YTB1_SELRU|nr:hypothetical protein [Selenomonas ruminantium]SFB16451.1 hypothetical protein SAMN05216587_1212 [Selenomonas ruminantium]